MKCIAQPEIIQVERYTDMSYFRGCSAHKNTHIRNICTYIISGCVLIEVLIVGSCCCWIKNCTQLEKVLSVSLYLNLRYAILLFPKMHISQLLDPKQNESLCMWKQIRRLPIGGGGVRQVRLHPPCRSQTDWVNFFLDTGKFDQKHLAHFTSDLDHDQC